MDRRGRGRNRRALDEQDTNVDVTAFLNLMVVLIPFLLLSAAFNHLTAFDLFLPKDNLGENQQQVDEPPPEIFLSLRKGFVQLSVNEQAELPAIETDPAGRPDLKTLHSQLAELKQRYPNITAITLLSEPKTDYERIIYMMDNVREGVVEVEGRKVNREFFPDIALGDAQEEV